MICPKAGKNNCAEDCEHLYEHEFIDIERMGCDGECGNEPLPCVDKFFKEDFITEKEMKI